MAHGSAADADDGEIGREQLLTEEIVESGNKLAAGEVTGKAENRHDTWIRGASHARFGCCWHNFCLSHRILVRVSCGAAGFEFGQSWNLIADSSKLFL